MQFKKSDRDRILKFMNKFRNSGFVEKFQNFIYKLIPCNTKDSDFCLCIVIIKIFPFILVIISLAAPYIMIFYSFYFNLLISLKILSIFSSIFFLISLLGIYGKGMVFCLTYPCNWFFLMLCADFLTIVCEGFIFRIYFFEEFHYNVLLHLAILGNMIFTFIFFIQHFRVYKYINLVFTAMILMELDYIYYGSHQIMGVPVS